MILAITYLAHGKTANAYRQARLLTAPHLGSRKALSNDGKVRIVIQVEVLGLWPLADGIDCKHDNCA